MLNTMALRRMLSDVSGSRKSKMAIVKPEIHVSQLVDKIESKFQRQVPLQLIGTKEDIVRHKRKSHVQDGSRLTGQWRRQDL